jgi:hypothetical protein
MSIVGTCIRAPMVTRYCGGRCNARPFLRAAEHRQSRTFGAVTRSRASLTPIRVGDE